MSEERIGLDRAFYEGTPKGCCRKGCTKDGTHRPIITFTAVGFPHRGRARAEIGMLFCAEHMVVTGPEDLVTDEAWARIVQGIRAAGRADPDRASLRIEWRHERFP